MSSKVSAKSDAAAGREHGVDEIVEKISAAILEHRLMPGTKLGAGVLVGAGAVVKGEFPDYAVVAGVPARVLRSRGGS